jgi:hypothetical protein
MQVSTARSTADAEYLSVSDLAGEILYYLFMPGKIVIPQVATIDIAEDNQGCIAISMI